MIKNDSAKINIARIARLTLIITVLAAAVILITLACLHTYINKNMSDAGLYYEENRAYMAALAGIDYAKMRIEQDKRWEGDNSANDITEKEAGDKIITIKENYNYGKCVKGEIKDKANQNVKTSFYITFNYYPQISKYRSYNCIETAADPAFNTTQPKIPYGGVLIVVKGESRGRAVYVESGFMYGGPVNIQFPGMASRQIRFGESSDITPTPLPAFVIDAADLLPIKIYSKFATDSKGYESLCFNKVSVDLNGGKADTMGHYFEGLPAESVNMNVNQPIPNLDLNTIKEKQLNKWPATNTLKAGKYVVMPDVLDAYGNPVSYKIEYRINDVMQKTYTPNETKVPQNRDNAADKLTGIEMDGSKLKIQEPQKVEPFDTQKDIKIMGEGLSGKELPGRVKVIMDKKGENQPYIINEGVDAGITISGELSGDGGVFANGDVTFQGKTILNTTVDNGVSVFAGGSITMEDIPATVTDQDTGDYQTVFKNFAKTFYLKELPDGRLSGSESIMKLTIKRDILNLNPIFVDKSKSSEKRKEIQSFKNDLVNSTSQTTRDTLAKNFNIFNAWLLNGFDYEKNDSVFYGLLYSKKNFNCNISGKFTLFGSIIVKGDGSFDNGDLIFRNSKGVVLYYDPRYLGILSNLYAPCWIDQKYLNKL